jgi:hypothetical protein
VLARLSAWRRSGDATVTLRIRIALREAPSGHGVADSLELELRDVVVAEMSSLLRKFYGISMHMMCR